MNYNSDAFLMQPMSPVDTLNWNDFSSRVMRYKQYLDFYRGFQWNELRRPGERRLTVNYARTYIQKQASYFISKPLNFELKPNGDNKKAQDLASKTETALREIWTDNALMLADYDAAVDAAVLGDGCFKVSLQKHQANHDPLTLHLQPGGTGGRVVVRAIDINEINAGFNGGNHRDLNWVSQTYKILGYQAREQYGKKELDKTGLNSNILGDDQECQIIEYWTHQGYKVTVQGFTLFDGANPYGFIPYVIFPNRSIPRTPWGESDLEDVITLASEMNVRVSVLSQLLQMSGNPVLVLENVDTAENMRVGPGAVWTLPEGAKASLLEMLTGGGVELHIRFIELLEKMMHDLTETPSTGFGHQASGGGGRSAASGVALEIMLHPVMQRVNRKRLIWDDVIDRRNRMIMRLAGMPMHRTRVIWPDVLPKDRAGLVTQEVGLVATNIHSLETARRVLGDEEPLKENEMIVAEKTQLAAVLGGLPGTGTGTQTLKRNNAGASGVLPPVHLSGALVNALSQSGG